MEEEVDIINNKITWAGTFGLTALILVLILFGIVFYLH